MKFRAPILINALTGGTRRGLAVNARLAEVAKRTGLPLAVGSQKVALDCPEVAPTFTIVRHVFPDGVIFANLSAASSVEDARRAVAMLRAQGLQLHLNAAQRAGYGRRTAPLFGATALPLSLKIFGSRHSKKLAVG